MRSPKRVRPNIMNINQTFDEKTSIMSPRQEQYSKKNGLVRDQYNIKNDNSYNNGNINKTGNERRIKTDTNLPAENISKNNMSQQLFYQSIVF